MSGGIEWVDGLRGKRVRINSPDSEQWRNGFTGVVECYTPSGLVRIINEQTALSALAHPGELTILPDEEEKSDVR
jgi:hypothetical protein